MATRRQREFHYSIRANLRGPPFHARSKVDALVLLMLRKNFEIPGGREFGYNMIIGDDAVKLKLYTRSERRASRLIPGTLAITGKTCVFVSTSARESIDST